MAIKRLQYMRTNHYALAVAEGERVLEARRRMALEFQLEQQRREQEEMSPSPIQEDPEVQVKQEQLDDMEVKTENEPAEGIHQAVEDEPMEPAEEKANSINTQQEDDDDWLSDVDAPHELVDDDQVPDVQAQQHFWHELLLNIRREQSILGAMQSDDLGEIDEKMIDEWADYYAQ